MAGVLRVFNFNTDLFLHLSHGGNFHLISVLILKCFLSDICTNALLAVAWEIAQEKSNKVYNIQPPTEHSISLKESLRICVDVSRNCPLSSAIWYPTFTAIDSDKLYKFALFFYQYLPGILFDTFFYVTKNSFRVLPTYKKYVKLNDVTRAFMFTQGRWKLDNVMVNAWYVLTLEEL